MKGIPSRTAVVRILVAAAFVLIAYLVYLSWPTIDQMLSTGQWWWLGLAIAALALANVGMAVVFTTLVQQPSSYAVPVAGIAGSFLVSQVAKYIPGRVWGVAAQAAMLRTPGLTSGILAANLEVVIVNIAMVTGAGIAFLTWPLVGFLPALMVLFATWGLGGWTLRLDGIKWIAGIALRVLPRRGHRLFAGLAGDGAETREGKRVPMYGGLLVFLVMYSLGWWLLATIVTSLDASDSMAVVAALSLSYIVGVASMLPAGIGAREGALVLLAPVLGVPHVDMAALAVTSRAAMVLMDAVAVGIGVLLLRKGLAEGGADV